MPLLRALSLPALADIHILGMVGRFDTAEHLTCIIRSLLILLVVEYGMLKSAAPRAQCKIRDIDSPSVKTPLIDRLSTDQPDRESRR